MEKQCQSCGMPLKDNQGAEADGSLNSMYCNLCYKDGSFCNPNASKEEMKLIVNNALKEKGWIAPLRWVALLQIPTLKRWRK
ncbi:zinc ribbon domain-containing protein [Candidatus Dojkabacteria bacterium]|uniref:Zinc ribbon domain-containing protein n=1 Tax=Candidatus Dojkabacteria bacterium TaxID=2099670 RepID=A0A955L2E7_9BACT|nr:zinc ribbon domain-containing protein [Candidatus Dojkabacteria bacterium]